MDLPAGKVTHYFSHVNIAVIDLCSRIAIGDMLRFQSETTDLIQKVEYLEVNKHKVRQASAGVKASVRCSQPVEVGASVIKIMDSAEPLSDCELWKLLEDTHLAISYSHERVDDIFMDRTGVERWGAGLLLAAYDLEPESTTAARLQIRIPYTSTSVYNSRLGELVSLGLLDQIANGEFRLNERGRSELQTMLELTNTFISRADPLPQEDSNYLASLLHQVVISSAHAAQPPGNWSIRHAMVHLPHADPPLPFIYRLIEALQAYRDDAHLAGWKPTGLLPLEMECLTAIWKREADSIDALEIKLQKHGVGRSEIEKTVERLASCTYLPDDKEPLSLTESGASLREQIEQDTDRMFFAPWAFLDLEKRNSIACLAKRLKMALEAKYLK